MNREEEIKEASINYTRKNKLNVFAGDKYSEVMREYDRNKAFEEGAEWADKTMIEKACKIAKDILSSYSFVNYPHEMQDFLVDFRKAMEGENMSSYVKKFHIIYDGNDGRTYDEYIYCKYNNGCDVQNWCSEDGSPLDFESVTDSQAYVRSCCIANIPIDLVWKDNKCFYWEEIKEFTLPKSVIKTFKDK